MAPRLNWFDRSFGPEMEADVYPAVIERLSGLLPRVEAKLRSATPESLTQRWAENHNGRPVEEVVAELRVRREHFTQRLASLAPGEFSRTSKHPRLGSPMRLLDLMLFVAEHDDHHLLRVAEILGQAG